MSSYRSGPRSLLALAQGHRSSPYRNRDKEIPRPLQREVRAKRLARSLGNPFQVGSCPRKAPIALLGNSSTCYRRGYQEAWEEHETLVRYPARSYLSLRSISSEQAIS